MSIELVNVAQTEHEFLCLIDMNNKDTYGIRRVHSTDIKCIERSNRSDVFCKNIFLKILQKTKDFRKKPCRTLFLNKVAGLGHRYFLED